MKYCFGLRLLALGSSHKAAPGNSKGDVNIKHFDLHRKELYLRLLLSIIAIITMFLANSPHRIAVSFPEKRF